MTEQVHVAERPTPVFPMFLRRPLSILYPSYNQTFQVLLCRRKQTVKKSMGDRRNDCILRVTIREGKHIKGMRNEFSREKQIAPTEDTLDE